MKKVIITSLLSVFVFGMSSCTKRGDHTCECNYYNPDIDYSDQEVNVLEDYTEEEAIAACKSLEVESAGYTWSCSIK